jgi:hypothetical protein
MCACRRAPWRVQRMEQPAARQDYLRLHLPCFTDVPFNKCCYENVGKDPIPRTAGSCLHYSSRCPTCMRRTFRTRPPTSSCGEAHAHFARIRWFGVRDGVHGVRDDACASRYFRGRREDPVPALSSSACRGMAACRMPPRCRHRATDGKHDEGGAPFGRRPGCFRHRQLCKASSCTYPLGRTSCSTGPCWARSAWNVWAVISLNGSTPIHAPASRRPCCCRAVRRGSLDVPDRDHELLRHHQSHLLHAWRNQAWMHLKTRCHGALIRV